MITSVPLWEHVIVVLALFGSNALLFFISKRKIETLQSALLAKRVLLNEKEADGTSRHTLIAGETLSLRLIPASRVDIRVDAAVTLNVVYIR